jgi:hypothetical protein
MAMFREFLPVATEIQRFHTAQQRITQFLALCRPITPTS